MLRNYLENTELSGYHPSIDNYVASASLTTHKSNAEKWLIRRLKNDNVKLRQLMLTLDLTIDTSVEETDEIERLRVAVTLNSVPAQTTTYTLYGRNDEVDDWESVTTVAFTTAQSGTRTATFNKPYIYYKLTVSPSVTPDEAYLIETTFDLVFTYVTLAYIARSLKKSAGDVWTELYDGFIQDAVDAYSTLVFPQDLDNDGTYDSDSDEINNTKSTQLFL